MNSREASFITNHVGPWLKTRGHTFGKSVTFEAKETATTIGDNDFETQQLPSLRESASQKGLFVKIPDGSGIAAPFDGFFISNAYALIAIQYRNKGWVLIDIKRWDSRTKLRVDWEYAKELADFWYC